MQSCEVCWGGFLVHQVVVMVKVVDDDCHTRGMYQVFASGSHCGVEYIDRAIEVHGFDAFPVFGSCAVVRMSTGHYASCVYDKIWVIASESSLDALSGPWMKVPILCPRCSSGGRMSSASIFHCGCLSFKARLRMRPRKPTPVIKMR
jgi:hypothetical protein